MTNRRGEFFPEARVGGRSVGAGSAVFEKSRLAPYFPSAGSVGGLRALNAFGSFCFRVSTGANRSPVFFSRRRACSGLNESSWGFLRRFNSSQLTGIETKGCARFPRIE